MGLRKEFTLKTIIYNKNIDICQHESLQCLHSKHWYLHNLNQWWPIPVKPYGITRPQWIDKQENTLDWILTEHVEINVFCLSGSIQWNHCCHIHDIMMVHVTGSFWGKQYIMWHDISGYISEILYCNGKIVLSYDTIMHDILIILLKWLLSLCEITFHDWLIKLISWTRFYHMNGLEYQQEQNQYITIFSPAVVT